MEKITNKIQYYGKPTICTNCGKPTEKKRNNVSRKIKCLKCQRDRSKKYSLKYIKIKRSKKKLALING